MVTTQAARKQRITFLSYWREEQHFFAALMKCLPDNVIGRNISVRTRSLARLLYAFTPSFLPTKLSEEHIDAMIQMDLRERMARTPAGDQRLIRKRLQNRAKKWHRYFAHALRGTDLLVVWNGFQTTKQSALTAAKLLGIKTAFIELGAIPNTLAVDPNGINYNNTLSGKPAEFFMAVPLDQEKVDALLYSSFDQRSLRKTATPVQEAEEDLAGLPERFILFAMQVHDDSQVLMYSPRFHSMVDAVSYIDAALAQYRIQTGDNLRLVVKEHPSDYGRIDYSPLRDAMPEVVFLRRTPVRDLITRAAAVLTINSSVGIEALRYMRPVITLGDAFYNIPGMVRHLEAHESLTEALAETLARPVNTELITRFLCFLRYQYLVPGSYYTTEPSSLRPVVDRLLDILHDRIAWR